MDFNQLFHRDIQHNDGVYEVTLAPKEGYCIVTCENKYDEMTLRVRKLDLPRIGSRKTINGKNVKVTDIETDEDAHVWVLGDGGLKERIA